MALLLRLRWFLLPIFTLISLASCRKEGGEEIIFTGEPEFSVDLFEQRAPADGTPTFGLWVESMKNQDCANFGIEATMQVQSGNIEITLLGVSPVTPCAGNPAPAKQFLEIGNLPDGAYDFTLSLRDVVTNKGTLTVTNSRYTLSLPNPQGIDFQNLILEKLPDGIVWGYASTPDESSEPVADKFLLDLKTLTTENGLAAGFYSYFTVAGTGDVFFHKSIAPAGSAESFVRRLSDTPDALKGLLKNYRDAAQQPLEIRCWTTQGEF